MKLKVVYEDLAVGARENFSASASGASALSNLSLLTGDEAVKDYINPCELNFVLLNAPGNIIPNDTSNCFALISNEVSDENGDFTTDPVLTLTSSGQYSSQGLTFVFDERINRFPKSISVQWYNGSTLLSEMSFTPDSAKYFAQNPVEGYNKLVVTFSGVNMPYNRLTLKDIMYGKIREFGRPDIESFSLLHDLDPVGASIKINTMDFSLKQKTDIAYVFQEKQAVRCYFDDELVSTTFIKSYQRNSRYSYDIESEDYIGLLDDTTFMGGMYSSKSFPVLIGEILDPVGVPYTLSDDLTGVTVSGYIPACSRREALRQAVFAASAVADTSWSKNVDIYTLDDTVSAVLDSSNTFTGQQTRIKDKLTELHLAAYAYVPITDTFTAYDAADSGTGSGIKVLFSEPLHDLSITNGSITESGVNYAIITANSGCVLTGKKYDKTQSVTVIRNPNVLSGDKENIKEITDFTLVNRSNVDALAQRCFDYYSNRYEISEKIIAGTIKVGDKVTQSYGYMDDITERITTMKFNVSGSAKCAEVTIT